MLKHLKRFGAITLTGLAAVGVLWALLITDIPKNLLQADQSFAFIAKTLGIQKPPANFVSEAWQNLWMMILGYLTVCALVTLVLVSLGWIWEKFISPSSIADANDDLSHPHEISIVANTQSHSGSGNNEMNF